MSSSPSRPIRPCLLHPSELPLGALAAGLGMLLTPWLVQAQSAEAPPVPVVPVVPAAQQQPPAAEAPASAAAGTTLSPIRVKGARENAGKDSYRSGTTSVGKGQQDLRDVPQSITVVTEKLIDDRRLDTLKDVLHNTAGVTFLAAEGGEEDIRLRGFSLASTGDLFVDGLRDPAFYERDTFNDERVELLRGSASMLFGRGSTGGVVNQVSKQPKLVKEHEVQASLGSHQYRRLTGDFNLPTSEDAALRINAMANTADNNGSGSAIDKKGLAAGYRWGIGSDNEFTANLYHLQNRNGINYGLPWIRPRAGAPVGETTVLKDLDPASGYSMASDRNDGDVTHGTLRHVHRFDHGSELSSVIRSGVYERDQRASTIRFAGTTPTATNPLTNPVPVTLDTLGPNTVLNRGTQLKVQSLHTTYVQSDYKTRFQTGGLGHELLTGVDAAQEKKEVKRATTPPGVNLTKPQTFYGSPFDGASINEDARLLSTASRFKAEAYGVYVQDLVQVAPHWKLLGGLRYDHMDGRFDNVAVGGAVSTYEQKISAWSRRFGALYQPSDRHSFHVSYGTSFNTSGDTYSYNPLSANTAPERSENLEVGAKIDSANKRLSTRVAVFRSVKTNERNTDVDTASTAYLLSGKRHSAGVELDVTGRLTPSWEVFGSYVWQPIATIDQASPTAVPGERQGERPWLTPRSSGTLWTTYQFTPKWRAGGGVNWRSSQTPNRNPGWAAEGYATADLMAQYFINHKTTVQANLSNVTNKLAADALYSGHYTPLPGRLLQFTLATKF
ncbi:MAG: TonB-dependent siderophore receptor [Pseudomonadota bacterium]